METYEYEDSLFSSLLGEGLEKDNQLLYAGVKGTPVDKYEISAGNLLQDLDPLQEDPFADWMTEKIDFDLLGQTNDFLTPESTITSSLDELLDPKDIECLQVGPDDLELLKSLAVDPAIPPVSPALCEDPAPDLVALSPSPSISSVALSPSPSSISSVAESAPGSPIISMNSPIEYQASASDLLTQLVQFQQNDTVTAMDIGNLVPNQHLTPPTSPESNSNSEIESLPSPKDTKKREAPKRAKSKVKSASGTTIVDKKSRKRDQNKVAATRYREKKRAESMAVQSEEDILVERNKELKEQVESLAREIKYMKELMVDVYKAKGIAT